MKFAGLIKQSLIDYPGEVATVLFTRGCNFSCPFCHNGHLLYGRDRDSDTGLEKILAFLQERKGFIDAVVVSGGEPTRHGQLIDTVRAIKDLNLKVKLDTNGSNPEMLEELLDSGLLDYIAMDVKAPLDYRKYLMACGRLSPQDFLHVRNSCHLLLQIKDEPMVEFRTTVVPALHRGQDIVDIVQSLQGARLYTLQQFQAANAMDPAMKVVAPFSPQQLEMIADRCAGFVEKIRVLG